MKWMVLCLMLVASFSVKAQSYPDTDPTAEADSTFYVVDSVAVGINGMQDLSPEKIASISVVSGPGVIRKFGEKAANGVIYIETKAFARKHYTAMFAASSPAYAKLLKENKGNDSLFAYVLNGRLLTTNPEGELSGIKVTELRAISVMPAKDVQREYAAKDKIAGVLITTGAISAPGDGAFATAR